MQGIRFRLVLKKAVATPIKKIDISAMRFLPSILLYASILSSDGNEGTVLVDIQYLFYY